MSSPSFHAHPVGVMEHRRQHSIGRASFLNAWNLAWLATSSVLLFMDGCATHQPGPITIQRHHLIWCRAAWVPTEIRLELVTFNIWGLPSWLNGATDARFSRIAGELERLQPDFVLLQEVWTRRAADAIPCSAGWWRAHRDSPTLFGKIGLVTLSKHPIVGGEFFPFNDASFPSASSTRERLRQRLN
jgi:hypothetical protein